MDQTKRGETIFFISANLILSIIVAFGLTFLGAFIGFSYFDAPPETDFEAISTRNNLILVAIAFFIVFFINVGMNKLFQMVQSRFSLFVISILILFHPLFDTKNG